MLACVFNGCSNPALAESTKCAFHKFRDQCRVAGCTNQAYARRSCARHGGKRPCAHRGCQGNARTGNLCMRHVPQKRLCQAAPDCSRAARIGGRCVAHGGGRLCAVDGCSSFSRVRGLCQRHHVSTTADPTTATDDLDVLSHLQLDDALEAFLANDDRRRHHRAESFDIDVVAAVLAQDAIEVDALHVHVGEVGLLEGCGNQNACAMQAPSQGSGHCNL
ncbi:Aste57867_5124 [Aphanomyces stellatus]|uniref:Aste57867_5124 protein n=1 Tax=Aphanomyces stellatus TaxID=120398 RepID=A0A485KDW4_9STRA|nr:hypothetical protein As57867_005111 [Aphanomyces stellatus]VFT82204.1 Aste57867_5124 [Aphanomyces stellatus]